MFEGGIGPEELAEIERDEFVHYLTLTYVLGDPGDWPRFRRQLLEALTAARALDAIFIDRDPTAEQLRVLRCRQAALDLIEDVRRRHDPTTAWPAFFDALWEQRAVMDAQEVKHDRDRSPQELAPRYWSTRARMIGVPKHCRPRCGCSPATRHARPTRTTPARL